MQRTSGVEIASIPQARRLDALAAEIKANPPGRLVVAGGPRCGKSTLSGKLDVPVFGGDRLIGLGWSESSLAASRWFDEPGPWVAEGVVMPRALRKWLGRNSSGKPADLVIWIGVPVVARTQGQEAMARGCETVWHEIRRELVGRGVRVRELT